MKVLFYGVLLPAALLAGLVLGKLACDALRGVTPRLPLPEPLVIGACVVCLVAMVVAIILDIRGE